MSKLVELRNKLDAKRQELAGVFEAAGGDLDFNDKTVLDLVGAKDSTEAVERVRAMNKEIEDLHDEAKGLVELENMRDGLDGVGKDLHRPAAAPRQPDPTAPVIQGLGDVIVGSPEFEAAREAGSDRAFEVEGYGLPEIRATLLESTTGVTPEAVRSGRLVEAVTRPIQVLDIIPTGRTDQNAYVYEEEVLRTHNAAEMREGGTYAEDAYKWVERSEPVRKIGTSIPVTDEQLEDKPGLQSYLNNRLAFGIRQRFDSQVINGNGTAPNVSGILDRAIQTQAKGTDPVPDAIHKAITKVVVTGRSNPNYVLLHQNDWQDIRLLRTADGLYIWGSPSDAGVARIWGLPVVQTDVLTENTGLVGDFMFCQAFERRGVDVQVGFTGTQFVEGKKTIRADVRVAFAVFRAAAFCSVTGI